MELLMRFFFVRYCVIFILLYSCRILFDRFGVLLHDLVHLTLWSVLPLAKCLLSLIHLRLFWLFCQFSLLWSITWFVPTIDAWLGLPGNFLRLDCLSLTFEEWSDRYFALFPHRWRILWLIIDHRFLGWYVRYNQLTWSPNWTSHWTNGSAINVGQVRLRDLLRFHRFDFIISSIYWSHALHFNIFLNLLLWLWRFRSLLECFPRIVLLPLLKKSSCFFFFLSFLLGYFLLFRADSSILCW